MDIDSNQFCYLSTSESFLGWLYRYAPALHTQLIQHLKQGKGCASNRQKMLDILSQIKKEEKLSLQLASFIQENYPHLIKNDDQQSFRHVADRLNRHNVFGYYDPSLNTFPRRLILTQQPDTGLERDVLDFCSQHGYCEHLILEDRAYIEYLPPEYIQLKDQIPEENWEIRAYRRANHL